VTAVAHRDAWTSRCIYAGLLILALAPGLLLGACRSKVSLEGVTFSCADSTECGAGMGCKIEVPGERGVCVPLSELGGATAAVLPCLSACDDPGCGRETFECNGLDDDCDGLTDEDCTFGLSGGAFVDGVAVGTNTAGDAVDQILGATHFVGASGNDHYVLRPSGPGGSP